MHLSESEWIAVAIFIISVTKAAWDLWITNCIFGHYAKGKAGSELTREVKAKRRRDSIAGIFAFAAIAILTVLIIGEGAMTKELSREEFEGLDNRVKKIEEYFTPPDGGFPALSTLVQKLETRISGLENTSAKKEDVDELKRIVAEIQKTIPGQNQTFGEWPSN